MKSKIFEIIVIGNLLFSSSTIVVSIWIMDNDYWKNMLPIFIISLILKLIINDYDIDKN